MGKLKKMKPLMPVRPIQAFLPANATEEQIKDYNAKLEILRKRHPKPFIPNEVNHGEQEA